MSLFPPDLHEVYPQWTTVVVIELLCGNRNDSRFLTIYTKQNKKQNWTAASFIDSRPSNLETLKSTESLRKSRNNLRDSKLVK